MNYDEKIRELTERVEKLEKAENKRILKRKIEIISKIVIALVVLILLIIIWNYVNTNYIKPYKEKIDYVNEKVDNAQSFIDNQLGGIQKYFH